MADVNRFDIEASSDGENRIAAKIATDSMETTTLFTLTGSATTRGLSQCDVDTFLSGLCLELVLLTLDAQKITVD